jgi:hypothetical protein
MTVPPDEDHWLAGQGVWQLRQQPSFLGTRCRGDGSANYSCFLYCKKFFLCDAVFVRIQTLWTGENRGVDTSVDVMDDSVERRFGSGGAGPQQCWEFLL